MTTTVPYQRANRNRPPLFFVGEAPGDDEMVARKPLVGPSGRIFDAMLRTANIDRAECAVGNVFDTKLPDNDVANWCAPAAEAKAGGFDDIPPIGSAGFLRPEYRPHLERLKAEIEEANPDVIVPLGGTALWAFTGIAAIMDYRGAIVEATQLVPGRKIAPALHPAFIMRQWKYFTTSIQDLQNAWEDARENGPKVVYPPRQLLLEPTLEEIREIAPVLKEADLLSVDIETGWGVMTCIGFAPDQERAISIPFVDKRKPNRAYWPTVDEEVEAILLVKDIMESPAPKLGQNFSAYDAIWLWQVYGIETRNMAHDTRLLHHALYAELPKSLKFMGGSYSKQGPWKTMRGRYTEEKKDD